MHQNLSKSGKQNGNSGYPVIDDNPRKVNMLSLK